jgi:hypothetical protein
MRVSVVLLLCSLAGILGGGALIGLPALGGCLIFDSLLVGAYGLVTHDWGAPAAPSVRDVGNTLESIVDRARAS